MSAGAAWLGCRLVISECGDRGGRGASQVGDVAFDEPYLVDVGEREVGRGGAGLDGAGGDPAVSAVGFAMGDRGVGPGQCVEGGEQAGLVVLDGEHEPCAALVQVGGVVTLAVQRVGGHDQPAWVDAGGDQLVDQRGEQGDLVRFRADFDLAEYELVTMGGRGHQVHLGAVGGDRGAHRLAVDRDREQFPVGGVGVGRPRGGGRRSGGRGVWCPLGQPGADRRIDRSGVNTGQDPPQRRLRRSPGRGREVQPGQQLGGYVGDPAGDRGERTHPGQYRRRAQRQHHRNRVIPPLVTAPVGDPDEPSQQLRTLHRGRRQAPSNAGIGHDTINR